MKTASSYNNIVRTTPFFAMYTELLVPENTTQKAICDVVRSQGACEFVEGIAAAIVELS